MSRPRCAHCGERWAVCLGSYDEKTPSHACSECCGHGNEDGYCEPIRVPAHCVDCGKSITTREPDNDPTCLDCMGIELEELQADVGEEIREQAEDLRKNTSPEDHIIRQFERFMRRG